MKNVFISQWTAESYTLATKIIEKLSSYGERELAIHFLSNQQHIDVSLFLEQLHMRYPDVAIDVQTHFLTDKLSIREKIKHVQSLIREIGSHAERIYLQFHDGDAYLQQMIAHECVQLFPSQVIFFMENEDESYFSIGQSIQDREFYYHVRELVTSGNFSAAKKLTSNRVKNPLIPRLLDLGQKIGMLDLEKNNSDEWFDDLKEVLKQLDSEQSTEEMAYVDLMKKLPDRNQKAFIAFLHNYAELLYAENDLIDFIVLYYRLAEETLLYAIGWDIRWGRSTETSPFVVRKDAKYVLPIPNHEKLTKHYHRYLKVLSQEIRRIEERQRVKIRRDKCVGLDRLSPRDRYFAELYLFFKEKAFEEFLDLRHEGVSGHGFADFTKEEFEGILGCKPLTKIESILEQQNLLPRFSIFELIGKAVLALIIEELSQSLSFAK
jgi:hypothetical protein